MKVKLSKVSHIRVNLFIDSHILKSVPEVNSISNETSYVLIYKHTRKYTVNLFYTISIS